LVVDDEVSVCQMLQRFLEKKDYEVATASNGEEGLKKLLEENYSVAILDNDMPKLNGLKLYLKIRKEGLSIKDHIIFYTGSACTDLHQYLKRIKVPYLIKPTPLSKLKKYVEEHCCEPQ
ncbi:MAG: response regulator, partial [Thermodesulfobacteriota bacterium]